MCRSGPHHLVQESTTKSPSSDAGNTVRCATRPVNLGFSGPEQDLAHQRVDPVGADDGVRGGALPIGKAQGDAGAVALEADELLLIRDQLRRHGGEEGRVQIAAVHQEIGRAVPLLRLGAEGQLGQVLAGVPHAGSPRARLEGLPAQLRLEPERAQHAHGVRAHLDAGADALELLGLLVDPHVGALPRQEAGQRQPADAGADDCNARLRAHLNPSGMRHSPLTRAARAPPRAARRRFCRRAPRSSGRPC